MWWCWEMGPLGGWFHEVMRSWEWGSRNGICVLRRRRDESPLFQLHVRKRWEGTLCKARRGPSPDTNLADTLTLNFQPPELWKIDLYILSLPAYDILWWQPKPTKTDAGKTGLMKMRTESVWFFLQFENISSGELWVIVQWSWEIWNRFFVISHWAHLGEQNDKEKHFSCFPFIYLFIL